MTDSSFPCWLALLDVTETVRCPRCEASVYRGRTTNKREVFIDVSPRDGVYASHDATCPGAVPPRAR